MYDKTGDACWFSDEALRGEGIVIYVVGFRWEDVFRVFDMLAMRQAWKCRRPNGAEVEKKMKNEKWTKEEVKT